MPIESRPERPSFAPPQKERGMNMLLPEEESKMTIALARPPHGVILALPGKAKDDLKKELEALKTVSAKVSSLRNELKLSADPAKARELTLVFATFERDSLAFSLRRAALVNETAGRIARELSLPSTELEPLAFILQFGVSKPAADAPAELLRDFEAAAAERMDALRGLSAVVDAIANGRALSDAERSSATDVWFKYRRTKEVYDASSRAFGSSKFGALVGIDGSPENIRRFIEEVTAPLLPLSQAPARVRSNPNIARLAAKLEAQRAHMTTFLPSLVQSGFDPAHGEEWSWSVTEYLVNRGTYESAVIGSDGNGDVWSMYGTVVAQELLEEGAEALPALEIGNRVTFLLSIVGPARLEMINGMRALQAQGIPMREIGRVLESFSKSPLGPKFWSELFKVESGATILLWGLYLHNSSNKLQTSIQFGSFLALSNAVSKLSAPVMEALGVMKLAGKIPGAPFAVQFGIAMAAAFVAGDKIQEFAAWVDETIPDSPMKSEATVALGLVSGEPIFSGIEEVSDATGFTGLLDKTGMTGFDPDRDLMAYLGKEAITVDSNTLQADYRRIHTFHDWNDRLKQAISAQDNDIQKKLWETLRVDPGSWSSRQALQLFSTVASLRATEDSMSAELRSAGVFAAGDVLRASDIATADTDPPAKTKEIGIVDDLTNRNDRVLARAFDWDPSLSKAAKYFRSLPEKDARRESWETYVRACTQAAKNVGTYRHLGLYNRAQWLGKPGTAGGSTGVENMTPMVREGLMAEVRHQMSRRALLSPETYPRLTRRQFVEKLAGTVKLHEKFGFLEEGFLLLKNPAAYHGMMDYARDEYFALVFSLQDAEKTLLAEKLDAVLHPLREIILSGQVPSSENLRSVHKGVNDAIVATSLIREPVKEAPASVRADLGAPQGVAVLFQGDESATTYTYTHTNVNFNLGFNASETNTQVTMRPLAAMEFKLLPEQLSEFRDVRLMVARARDDGAFFRTYQTLSFDCPSPDRHTWRVLVQQQRFVTTHFKREEGMTARVNYSIRNDRDETLSFESWLKANVNVAAQIEPQLKVAQEQARVKEAKVAVARELAQLQERVLAGELDLHGAAMRGSLEPPTRLPRVPDYLARDPAFTAAYQRQTRLAELWKDLEDGGLQKIFEEWAKASRPLDDLRFRTILPPGRQFEQPALSVASIANGVRLARGKTTWVEHEAFLTKAATYVRLQAEQKDFLLKTPIPKPFGSQLPER